MDNNSLDSHHNRLMEYYQIPEQTWSSVEDLGSGIWVYRDVIPKEMHVIERLEEVLLDPNNDYKFDQATVGYNVVYPEYRDCYDFKYKKENIIHDTSEASLKLQRLWDETHYRQLNCVKDYSRKFNIGELRYWEATNFVKYGPNQHFQEHSDHGFSYNCTLSLVAFPNDNYEGGELYFRLQGLTVKPRAGDLYVFPSNFMYPHRAMPVVTGTKYSMVTMLDFSEKYHTYEMHSETDN